jgi:hypothetical protein
MEQRPLRLGDIVDDYCPRERRITNHAIVAIVEDSVRQTRCTTCEAEHAYKGAKMPRRRRKDSLDEGEAALVDGPGQLVPPVAADESADTEAGAAADPPAAEVTPDDAVPEAETHHHEDAWLAHRPLIRATLPRTEGDQPAPRPIPEFTMHQRQVRGSHAFRHGQGWANGNGQPRNGFRQGRSGNGPGPGQGQGHGQGRPGQGGGRHGRHGRHKKSR